MSIFKHVCDYYNLTSLPEPDYDDKNDMKDYCENKYHNELNQNPKDPIGFIRCLECDHPGRLSDAIKTWRRTTSYKGGYKISDGYICQVCAKNKHIMSA